MSNLSLNVVMTTPAFAVAPQPPHRTIAAPSPYPVSALGPVLAPMATKLIEVVQAPAALCAQSVLAAGALAVQGHANVVIDGRHHPLSGYFISPGAGGSPPDVGAAL